MPRAKHGPPYFRPRLPPQTKHEHLFEGLRKVPRYRILLGANVPRAGKSKEVSPDLWYRTLLQEPPSKEQLIHPLCCSSRSTGPVLTSWLLWSSFQAYRTLGILPAKGLSALFLPLPPPPHSLDEGFMIANTFEHFGLHASRLIAQGVQPPPAARMMLLKHKSSHATPLPGLAQVTPLNVTCAAQQ